MGRGMGGKEGLGTGGVVRVSRAVNAKAMIGEE